MAKFTTETQFRVFINKSGMCFPEYSNGKWTSFTSKGQWVTRRSVNAAKAYIEKSITWLGDREIAVEDGRVPSEEEQHLLKLKDLLAKKQNKSYWKSLNLDEFNAFHRDINAVYHWLRVNNACIRRIEQIEIEAGLC